MGFKDFIQEYFTFNKKERNGILVLCTLILFLILYLNLQQYFVSPPEIESKEAQVKIEEFLEDQKASDTQESENKFIEQNSSRRKERSTSPGSETSPEYFPFNPNATSFEDWLKMGLKDWQIQAVEKYRQKAGDFKSIQDFKRLRAINEDQFRNLEPFIRIPEIKDSEQTNDEILEVKKLPLYELNQSTASDLRKIRGIGPVLSGRIVEYRKLLGGFIIERQIMEVYGIEDSLFNAIASQIFVDESIVSKININKAPAERFYRHPYINRNTANGIVNYREHHGIYDALKDIRKTDVVSDELYNKILPYLSLY